VTGSPPGSPTEWRSRVRGGGDQQSAYEEVLLSLDIAGVRWRRLLVRSMPTGSDLTAPGRLTGAFGCRRGSASSQDEVDMPRHEPDDLLDVVVPEGRIRWQVHDLAAGSLGVRRSACQIAPALQSIRDRVDR